jgi:MscS family membrane protein
MIWQRQIALAALLACPCLLQADPAQLPATTPAQSPAPAKPAVEDPLGRQSPRGCVTGFLRAAGHGDYARASQYLNTSVPPAQAHELAQQLKVVLDRGLSGNFDALPRTSDGNLKEGLPATRQRIGSVKTKPGTVDILLERVQRDAGPPIWLFSAGTLQSVPKALGDLEAQDVTKYIPKALGQARFLWLPLWRWLAILLAILLALVTAHFLTRALMPPLRSVVRHITGEHDDRRLASLRTPFAVILLAMAVRALGFFAVSLLAREIWSDVAEILAVVGIAWLAIRFSDILFASSARRLLLKRASDKMALLAFTRRLFKVLVSLVTMILLLRSIGVNVSAMLTGLGIGGVAVALAAQKTLENFFGGVTIIMREVARVGDFCKIADQVGTIEDVGFGSTRVRTLDRTVVSVSNAQASQTSIENYTMRDKFWFHHIFGLRYDTSAEQMRHVLDEIGTMLRTHPKMERDSARIRLIEFGSSSLDVEVFAYILQKDYVPFLDVQEDLLLRIMDIIAVNGTHLALPSQFNYLDRSHTPRSTGEQSPDSAA